MSKRPQLNTQFIILILFGDVIVHHGGSVWTSSLLQMLEVLGISERAARSTLSRMLRKGWLNPKREGRHSLYALTARGRRILEEGSQRIFEPRHLEWDGQWYMAVYSLPETKRALRNDLRKRLSWLGFGRLAFGTWISPHNRQAEVEAMLDDLNAREYVQLFSGLHLAGGDDRRVVEQCWDMKGLNQQYACFTSRWEPEYQKCAQTVAKGDGLSPAQCFAQRFWITQAYSPFPRLDPNLPTPLLPEGWQGTKAAELFNGYRRLLKDQTNEFIEATLRGPNGRRL
jgi:phenylacetic acid degradation operon negative regulatory protein